MPGSGVGWLVEGGLCGEHWQLAVEAAAHTAAVLQFLTSTTTFALLHNDRNIQNICFQISKERDSPTVKVSAIKAN